MIFLLYVFCCNIMQTTVEGAENNIKLTKEEKAAVDAGKITPREAAEKRAVDAIAAKRKAVFEEKKKKKALEGAENKGLLTQEEKDNIKNMCKESYSSEDKQNNCIDNERFSTIKKKKAKQEAQQLKDDMGISSPGGKCPKITSFYTLFSKAYCVADNIRKGAQNV